jgi:nucleoside-diphosphate-sugar epimerase
MRVFLTGASGYIGGTVAAKLLAAGHSVTGLVRGADKAALLQARGITPVLGALEDNDVLIRAASDADAVINTANADHRPSVEAMLGALAGSGKFFLHTSGAGIVADMAEGAERAPVYDEETPVHPLPARAPRLALINDIRAAAKNNIRSVVVAPPMIYGHGDGLHPHSIQIPKMIDVARQKGAVLYVGPGTNRWSNVHVEDLADLYLLALEKAPGGAFYYAECGREEAFGDIAAAIGTMLGLPTRGLTVPEAYEVYGQGPVDLSFGSNCRVRAARPRAELGWSPRRKLLLDEITNGAYAQR